MLEATAVHPSGLLTPHTLGGYLPEHRGRVPARRRGRAAARDAAVRPALPRRARADRLSSAPARAGAVGDSEPALSRRAARALAGGDRPESSTGYARAAELAAAGGLDGVEISAAHRYLIEQFLDPTLNRREDAWRDGTRVPRRGAPRRARAAPELCVGVRLSADSERAAARRGPARRRGRRLRLARARRLLHLSRLGRDRAAAAGGGDAIAERRGAIRGRPAEDRDDARRRPGDGRAPARGRAVPTRSG